MDSSKRAWSSATCCSYLGPKLTWGRSGLLPLDLLSACALTCATCSMRHCMNEEAFGAWEGSEWDLEEKTVTKVSHPPA